MTCVFPLQNFRSMVQHIGHTDQTQTHEGCILEKENRGSLCTVTQPQQPNRHHSCLSRSSDTRHQGYDGIFVEHCFWRRYPFSPVQCFGFSPKHTQKRKKKTWKEGKLRAPTSKHVLVFPRSISHSSFVASQPISRAMPNLFPLFDFQVKTTPTFDHLTF